MATLARHFQTFAFQETRKVKNSVHISKFINRRQTYEKDLYKDICLFTVAHRDILTPNVKYIDICKPFTNKFGSS